MTETLGVFDTMAYLRRCVQRGWGIPYASKDVWTGITAEELAELEALDAEMHPGWQAPLTAETNPFALLTNWTHQSALYNG